MHLAAGDKEKNNRQKFLSAPATIAGSERCCIFSTLSPAVGNARPLVATYFAASCDDPPLADVIIDFSLTPKRF